MKASELPKLRMYAGDLSALYGMQEFCYAEGKARGMRGITMQNGKGLSATLLPDRCLDIPYLSFKGVNLGCATKVGLCAPAFYSPASPQGFLKQFNAGFLTTCGLMNAGSACEVDGYKHPLHGEIGNTPCANVNKAEVVEEDAIVLEVSGEAKEACVFGEHLVLHRRIRMETERNVLHICDVVENRGFSPAPLMNMYHINFGYPLLDAGATIHISTEKVEPRDEDARRGLEKHTQIEPPEAGRPEECFIHTGGSGRQFAMLHNETLNLAVVIHFDMDALPFLNEWKSMAAGDYALGLEPSAAGLWGLAYAKEHGLVRYLAPGGTQTYHIQAEILEGATSVRRYIRK